MIHNRKKLLDDRFAYEKNEEVLINALELCDELVGYDRLKNQYKHLLNKYEILLIQLEIRECEKKEYRRFSLTA